MDAHQPVTLKEGDRYPLGPPNKSTFKCLGQADVAETAGYPSGWQVQFLWNVFLYDWADSDNGSTVALQASGRGSIPRRSTNFNRRSSTTGSAALL